MTRRIQHQTPNAIQISRCPVAQMDADGPAVQPENSEAKAAPMGADKSFAYGNAGDKTFAYGHSGDKAFKFGGTGDKTFKFGDTGNKTFKFGDAAINFKFGDGGSSFKE
jgi:hypothetical protein